MAKLFLMPKESLLERRPVFPLLETYVLDPTRRAELENWPHVRVRVDRARFASHLLWLRHFDPAHDGIDLRELSYQVGRLLSDLMWDPDFGASDWETRLYAMARLGEMPLGELIVVQWQLYLLNMDVGFPLWRELPDDEYLRAIKGVRVPLPPSVNTERTRGSVGRPPGTVDPYLALTLAWARRDEGWPYRRIALAVKWIDFEEQWDYDAKTRRRIETRIRRWIRRGEELRLQQSDLAASVVEDSDRLAS